LPSSSRRVQGSRGVASRVPAAVATHIGMVVSDVRRWIAGVPSQGQQSGNFPQGELDSHKAAVPGSTNFFPQVQRTSPKLGQLIKLTSAKGK
jgi:hypothetical protein